METTEKVVPEHYNANQLVTYKVIDLDAPEETISYPTIKVNDLEWKLETARRTEKKLNEYISKVSNLEELLPDWLENDSDAAQIVADICSLFGFNPTKEIEFEGTISFSGSVSVPLSDIADFDMDSISFEIDINSYDGDVTIYNAEVDNVTTL